MSDFNLSEKVSVNINSATLSQIDILVDNGYFSNRSDFINHSLRVALEQQQSTLERLILQNAEKNRNGKSWFFGLFGMTARDVEEMYASQEKINLTGYGVLSIDKDVDEEKLFAVIQTMKIRGKVICSPSIKDHYGIK